MGLSTPKYARDMIGLMFLIPIAVLNEYKSRFGIVGKLCVKWGEAYFCVCTPDAMQLVLTSSCRHTRGYVEASLPTPRHVASQGWNRLKERMSSRGEVERASVERLQDIVLLLTTVASKPEEPAAKSKVETTAADIPSAPLKPSKERPVCQEESVGAQRGR
ncbi:hypothetical protein PInf_007878 [Phytophthora infestans]|nr:hypothetical protein PInf_007878 [Phytophthora infestans]